MAYQSEIEKLEQRFREKPEQWFAALADAYRKNGDLDLALEILDTWIEKRPTYTSGHIVQGRCLLDKGEDARAAEVFQRVLDLDPENIIALKSLGDIARRSSDPAGAREWLERLLEVDPMNDEAHEALEALGGPAESEGEVSPPPPPPAPSFEVAAVEQAEVEPAPAPLGSPFGSSPESPDTESPEPPSEFDSRALEQTPDPFDEVVPIADLDRAREEASVLEPPAPIGFEATVAEGPAFGLSEPEAAVEKDEMPADEPPAFGMTDAASADEPPPFGMAEVVPVDGSSDLAPGLATEEDEVDEAPVEIGGEQTHEIEAVSPEAIEPISLAPERFADESDVGVDSSDEDAGWAEGEAHAMPGTSEEPAEDIETVEAVRDDDVADAAAAPLASDHAEPEFATEPQPQPQPMAMDVEFEAHSVAEPEPAQPVVAADPSLDLIMPADVTPEVAEPTQVVTATMADLYVQQGLYEQAREMYGQLLEQDPGNGELAQKLADLAGMANTPVHAEAPAPRAQRFSVVMTGGESARALLLSIAGAAPEIRPSRPKPRVQPPAMPSQGSSGGGAASFDQFFGDSPQPAADAVAETPEAEAKEPGQGEDKAFQSWLKDLKT